MPFDGTGFQPPPGPRRRRKGPDLAAVLFAVIATVLLATPFSVAACADIVRYARAR